MTKFLNISTDNTLGGNSPSDETVSSQKAIKAYAVDKDLSTLSSTGKSTSASLPMPSHTQTVLTLGATGASYTATKSGWISFGALATSPAAAVCLRTDYELRTLATPGANGNPTIHVYLPVKAEETFYVEYADVDPSQWSIFEFIAAEGDA